MERLSFLPGLYETRTDETRLGPVQVEKTVVEREEHVDELLMQEVVDVEHIIKNERVSGPMPARQEGDTVIVPLVKQVLKVEKEWVLVEEIHLKRRHEMVPAKETVLCEEEQAEVRGRIAEARERRGTLGGRVPTFVGKLER